MAVIRQLTPTVAASRAAPVSPVAAAKQAENGKSTSKATSPGPAAVVNLAKTPTPVGTYYPQPAAKPAAEAKPAAPPKPAATTTSTPTAGLSTNGYSYTAGTGAVVVDVLASESGYENKIYWSSDNWQTRNLIGVDNQTGTVNLGTFAPGTQIQFGIDNGHGQFFTAGPASRNVDGIDHAKVTSSAEGVTYGFEDLRGGGDRDYNDAMIRVRSLAAPVDTGKTNRSGLGDGTNPGQGAGRANSPNQGTDNPAALKPPPATPVAVKPPTPPKPNPAALQPPPATPIAVPVPPKTNTAALKPPAASAVFNPVTPVVLMPPKAIAAQPAKTNPAALKAPTATPIGAAGNRSGLGDGTNPGQGAGKVNSPNQGTANPSVAARKVEVQKKAAKA